MSDLNFRRFGNTVRFDDFTFVHGYSSGIVIPLYSSLWKLNPIKFKERLDEAKSIYEKFSIIIELESAIKKGDFVKKEDRGLINYHATRLLGIYETLKTNPFVEEIHIDFYKKFLPDIQSEEANNIKLLHRRTPNKALKDEITRRDKNTCRYCGIKTTEIHFDHVNPYIYGGLTNVENLVTSCRSCNMKKRDRTPDEAGMQLLDAANPWYFCGADEDRYQEIAQVQE